MQEQLYPYLKPIRQLAKQAGQAILEIYQNVSDFKIKTKADQSPVTIADIQANAIIKNGLASLDAELPLLSEEEALIPYALRATWPRYWLVDPLDGTKEFIHHTDEFTVNIALIENHQPILGVIYIPMLTTSYFACKGHGAYKQEGDQEPEAIKVREVDEKHLVITVSRRHISDRLERFLSKMGNYEIINRGSSIKSCLIAEGSADFYPCLGPTSEWDTAAAQCIVEEGGGAMLDVNFKPLRYNTKDSLINPHFMVVGDKNYNWHNMLMAY